MTRDVGEEAKAGLPPDSCHLLSIFKGQHDRRCQSDSWGLTLSSDIRASVMWTHGLGPTWEISERRVNRSEALAKRQAVWSPLPRPPPHLSLQMPHADLPGPLLLPVTYFLLNTIRQALGQRHHIFISSCTCHLCSRLKAWSQRPVIKSWLRHLPSRVTLEKFTCLWGKQSLLKNVAIWIHWENVREVPGFWSILGKW